MSIPFSGYNARIGIDVPLMAYPPEQRAQVLASEELPDPRSSEQRRDCPYTAHPGDGIIVGYLAARAYVTVDRVGGRHDQYRHIRDAGWVEGGLVVPTDPATAANFALGGHKNDY
jgi:hypothetical protein